MIMEIKFKTVSIATMIDKHIGKRGTTKREKEEHQEISLEHKIELDNRLESYKNNLGDVLDWIDVKNNW